MSTVVVNDKKNSKSQAFEVRFCSISLVQAHKIIERSGYGNDLAYLTPLRDSLKQVKEAGWSSLKIIPLTEEGFNQPSFARSNYHYRGGKKYLSGGKNEEDANPIVIRGKPLAQISAHVWLDCDTQKTKIRFMSEEYNVSLTDNQQKELCERFGAGLLEVLTETVLEEAKTETLAYMIEYSKRDLAEIKERVTDLEKFLG